MIEDGNKVSIEYTLNLDDGTTVDSNVGAEPLSYMHGSGQILPALESALAGLSVDDSKKVTISAADGYGEVNPEAFEKVSPDQIPADAREVGAMLTAQDNEGHRMPVRVHEVTDEYIVVDLNHPLAGQTLHFEVKIVGIE